MDASSMRAALLIRVVLVMSVTGLAVGLGAFPTSRIEQVQAKVDVPNPHIDYIHLNDNYSCWDDDMMVGSVHLVEYLELAYWLKRLEYRGWLTLDIFPYREDGVRAATECKRWMETFFAAIDRVGMDAAGAVIREADACKSSELVRRALSP